MSKKRITVPFFVPHNGCPNLCIFCDQKTQAGREPLPEEIIPLIKQYRKSAPDSVTNFELAFFGGSFTGIEVNYQKQLLKEAKSALEMGLVSGIRVSTRPDAINKETLSLLNKYSVKTIEIGAQSFSDDVLKASGRGHTAKQTIEAAQLIKQHGFDLVIQLLPGLPLDSIEKSIRSAEIAAELNPSAARIYPAVVLEGTNLGEMFKSGAYSPLSVEEAVEWTYEIMKIFQRKNINVIRIGINPVESGNLSKIIGGAYHPSFGQIVKSRLKRDDMEQLFLFQEIDQKSTILIPSDYKEEYIGQKRANIKYLEDKYKTKICCKFHSGELKRI
ncbi:MAG TPA: radical SAM protein [Spirochaetota bacterium]|nr:radical SAM protein [Spirochaetota bacterium]HOR43687.1 radical SAM protein [Spirochaetota bacterium]HOU85249.1 radical SAM protein [Spirochaetota bacterium]HPK55210.1 radical SAM protein [Spirochaetota bacterium]HQE58496.1 radical SAM protein [Spirochaetota bacterium]